MRAGFHIALAVLLAVALTVTACGRRGSLERPQAAEGEAAPETTATGPDRPFILDGLL